MEVVVVFLQGVVRTVRRLPELKVSLVPVDVSYHLLGYFETFTSGLTAHMSRHFELDMTFMTRLEFPFI